MSERKPLFPTIQAMPADKKLMLPLVVVLSVVLIAAITRALFDAAGWYPSN